MNRSNDECKTVGTNVAYKLQRMDENQRLNAEKLIHQVLCLGIEKKLTDHTFVVTMPMNVQQHPYPQSSYVYPQTVLRPSPEFVQRLIATRLQQYQANLNDNQ